MNKFDPNRRLVMASAKTVLGHALPVGYPLAIVENPAGPGEVDLAMATRLHASKLAGYQDEVHATPVETPEQERNRLALERLRDAEAAAPDGEDAEVAPTDDLTVWQEDDAETGKKKGARVTKDDLLAIAEREGVVVESDDNKPDLTRKIMEGRAQRAVQNGTNAETDGAGGQGDTANNASPAASVVGGAEIGPEGDAHGTAGEGPSDAE
jgi:hypothetical protein